MLKLTVFLIFAIAVTSAQEEEEVCLGAEDGEKIGVGADISCTEYWYCEGEYGYKEDCASLEDGEEYEFDYNTNDCGYADEVNCASGLEPEYPEPDPDPEYPEYPDPETQPPVTQTPGTTQQTTLDPTVPDIECPTDQPGKIIFFPSSNCSEYFICANGFRMKMTCMEGFTWNQQEQQCDYPIFSRCSQDIIDDGMNVNCLRTGFYSTAYPRDCTKFVFCSAGIPMVQNCPVGYAWNIDRCVERQFASCPDLRRLG